MSETSIALASPVPAGFAEREGAPEAAKPGADKRSRFDPTYFAITIFDRIVLPVVGIVFPTIISCALFFCSWKSILQIMSIRPLECTVELAAFSIVPIGMLVLWMSVLRPHTKLRLKRSFLAGMVIGSAASAVALSRLIQLEGIVTVAGICALLASLYIAFRIHHSWEFDASRKAALAFTFLGALFSFFSIVLAQLPSGLVRVAEALAVSDLDADKTKGMELLRNLHCQRELRMHCENKPTGSILFDLIPVNQTKLKQVFFALTGTVESFAPTNPTDANLGQQVVGSKLNSLSMRQSSFYIVPSVKNLCATTYWTMVFRNEDDQPLEARIKIHLPPLAVVNGMTFWMDGKPKSATVCSSASATDAYQTITQGRRDPALVSDIGNQSILAQCYPVPAGGETKLRIAVAEPMSISADSRATISLPIVEECNCADATEHLIQVETNDQPQFANSPLVKADGAAALFQGKISNRDLAQATLTLTSQKQIFKSGTWLRGTGDIAIHTEIVQLVHPAPKQLVVVLDTGKALKESASAILKEVSKISVHMPCTIFFSKETEVAPISVSPDKPIENKILDEGGCDNTRTLIQACDFAGRKADSAVLWIHGPQPGFDNRMYPLSPHLIPPTIYELRVDASDSQSGNRLLRNHRELGAVVQVAQHANIADDLRLLCHKWTQPVRQVVFTYTTKVEGGKAIKELPYSRETDSLAAHLNSLRLLGANEKQAAIDFAISKSIVTPVTSVVVLETSDDYQSFGINEHPELTKSPKKSSAQKARIRETYYPDSNDDLDTNKGIAYLNRRMYFYRFPADKEAGPTELAVHDIIKDQKSGGLVTPAAQAWPVAISSESSSAKPEAGIADALFKTFGLPVSDTQFQTIDRYNDNRLFEQAFDPERMMWMLSGQKAVSDHGAPNQFDLHALIAGLLMSVIMILCPLTVTGAVLFWYLKATQESSKPHQSAS